MTDPYDDACETDEPRPWLERVGIVLVLGTSALIAVVAIRVGLGLLGVW